MVKTLGTLLSAVLVALAGVWATGPEADEVVDELARRASVLLRGGTPASGDAYTVRPGDTLSGIAQRHGTSVEALVAVNADRYPALVENPGRIVVGWELRLPAGTAPAYRDGARATNSERVAPTAANAPGHHDLEPALEIARLVNAERGKAGLAPLAVDEGLMEVARKRAVEVSMDFSHAGLADDCPDCGENAGKRPVRMFSPAVQVDGWMTSTLGHRENVLFAGASRLGVGTFAAPDGLVYSVMVFQ